MDADPAAAGPAIAASHPTAPAWPAPAPSNPAQISLAPGDPAQGGGFPVLFFTLSRKYFQPARAAIIAQVAAWMKVAALPLDSIENPVKRGCTPARRAWARWLLPLRVDQESTAKVPFDTSPYGVAAGTANRATAEANPHEIAAGGVTPGSTDDSIARAATPGTDRDRWGGLTPPRDFHPRTVRLPQAADRPLAVSSWSPAGLLTWTGSIAAIPSIRSIRSIFSRTGPVLLSPAILTPAILRQALCTLAVFLSAIFLAMVFLAVVFFPAIISGQALGWHTLGWQAQGWQALAPAFPAASPFPVSIDLAWALAGAAIASLLFAVFPLADFHAATRRPSATSTSPSAPTRSSLPTGVSQMADRNQALRPHRRS